MGDLHGAPLRWANATLQTAWVPLGTRQASPLRIHQYLPAKALQGERTTIHQAAPEVLHKWAVMLDEHRTRTEHSFRDCSDREMAIQILTPILAYTPSAAPSAVSAAPSAVSAPTAAPTAVSCVHLHPMPANLSKWTPRMIVPMPMSAPSPSPTGRSGCKIGAHEAVIKCNGSQATIFFRRSETEELSSTTEAEGSSDGGDDEATGRLDCWRWRGWAAQ
jgi:hypothetical protein